MCASCRARHRLIGAVYAVVSWTAFILLVFVAMPRAMASANATPLAVPRSGEILSSNVLLAFYGALVFGIAIHEGAHALCAKRFGFTVTAVHLGTGPLLFQRRLAGVQVLVRLVPLGGLTVWHPSGAECTTRRRAAVALAGPLSNLGLAVVCWSARSVAPGIAIPAAFANLIAFIDNVAPNPGSTKVPNDGWQILKALTGSHWVNARIRRFELTTHTFSLARSGRREQAIAYLRGQIDRAGGDYPDAEALLCTLLLTDAAEADGSTEEGLRRSAALIHDRRAFPLLRAAVLNNRAYRLAVGGWVELMAEAEWCVREALALSPNAPNLRGTLALVLTRMGRYEEAEGIATVLLPERLKTVRSASGTSLRDATRSLAANRCTVALICARTGRLAEAEREYAEARSLDSSCVLLGELERILDGAPDELAPPLAQAAPTPAPTPSTAPAVVPEPASSLPARERDDLRRVNTMLLVPLLAEAVGAAVLIAFSLVQIATREPPMQITTGGALLRFHLDPPRVLGSLGVPALIAGVMAYAVLELRRSPRLASPQLGLHGRHVAQSGLLFNLLFCTPVLLTVLAVKFATDRAFPHQTAFWVGVVLCVVIAVDVVAIELLARGPLRLRRSERSTVVGLAAAILCVPLIGGGLLSSASGPRASRVSWDYFWVADATVQTRGNSTLP